MESHAYEIELEHLRRTFNIMPASVSEEKDNEEKRVFIQIKLLKVDFDDV